jgi:hypothetical protein
MMLRSSALCACVRLLRLGVKRTHAMLQACKFCCMYVLHLGTRPRCWYLSGCS